MGVAHLPRHFAARMETQMDQSQESSGVQKLLFTVSQRYQLFLDRVTPHPKRRWVAAGVVIALYLLRAATVGGFYIVSYALGIYLLNLLIGFLAPKIDPEVILGEIETDEESSCELPPTKEEEEFRPFIRKLNEFKFWLSTVKAFLLAIFCTFIPFLDIPVFWPILLIYFIALFTATMRKQIAHMIKYRYIPFNIGKPKFNK